MSASPFVRAALLLAMLSCVNASAGLLRDDEPPAEPREESPVVLPPAPKAQELLRYEVGATSSMTFAVDAKSISIADGDVVRFTSVITSDSGAANVSYEGIRCNSAERKLYASGRPDGSWNAFPAPDWRPVPKAGANSYQAALMKDFFCDGGTVAGKAATIVDRMKRKRPLR